MWPKLGQLVCPEVAVKLWESHLTSLGVSLLLCILEIMTCATCIFHKAVSKYPEEGYRQSCSVKAHTRDAKQINNNINKNNDGNHYSGFQGHGAEKDPEAEFRFIRKEGSDQLVMSAPDIEQQRSGLLVMYSIYVLCPPISSCGIQMLNFPVRNQIPLGKDVLLTELMHWGMRLVY